MSRFEPSVHLGVSSASWIDSSTISITSMDDTLRVYRVGASSCSATFLCTSSFSNLREKITTAFVATTTKEGYCRTSLKSLKSTKLKEMLSDPIAPVVCWSACKKFVCTISNWRSPNEVVVYAPRVSCDAAALLLHSSSVSHVAWDPNRPRLAISCMNDYKIYFWTPEGVSWFEIPVKKDEKNTTTTTTKKKRFGRMRDVKKNGGGGSGGIVNFWWIHDEDGKSRLIAMLSHGLICGVGGLDDVDGEEN